MTEEGKGKDGVRAVVPPSVPARNVSERSVHGLVVGLVVFLLMLAYSILGGGAFQAVELFFYRSFFPVPAADEGGKTASVVVVTKDEDANDYVQLKYRRPPNRWPRKAYADLLRRLDTLGAKVVGFDFVFQGPDQKVTDDFFAETLRDHGRTVLGMYKNVLMRRRREGDVSFWDPSRGFFASVSYLRPYGPFARAAAGSGLLNIAMGEDRRVREWIPLTYDASYDPAISPATVALPVSKPASDGEDEEEDEGPEEADAFIEGDRDLLPAWDLLLLLLYRDFDLSEFYREGRWVDREWKARVCERYRRGDFQAGLDFVQGKKHLHVPLNSRGHCLIAYEHSRHFETYSIANLLDPSQFIDLGQPESFPAGSSRGNGGDESRGRESIRLLQAKKGTASLRLHCVGGDDRALEGVDVLVGAMAEGFWTTGRSDSEGNLSLRDLPEGSYQVRLVRRLSDEGRQIVQIATLSFDDGQVQRKYRALVSGRWRRITLRFPEPRHFVDGKVALGAGQGGEGVAFCLRGRNLAWPDGDFQEQVVCRCSSDGRWRVRTSLPVEDRDEEFAGAIVAWKAEAGEGTWPPPWARTRALGHRELGELCGTPLEVHARPSDGSSGGDVFLEAVSECGLGGTEVWVTLADESDDFWPARLAQHARTLPLPVGGASFGPFPVDNPEGSYRLFVRGIDGAFRGKWVRNKGVLSGKIVLIGPTAQVDHDNHLTPVESSILAGAGRYSRTTPGVLIHGHAIEAIVTGREVVAPTGVNDFENLRKAAPFWGFMFFFLPAFGFWIRPFSARKALLWTLVTMAAIFASGLLLRMRFSIWVQVFTPMLFVFVTSLGVALLNYETVDKKRREVRGMFGKYLAPALVAQMEADPTKVALGGETKEITAFFSDIAGFSSFSERMTPEALVAFLNIYCSEMTDILLAHQGYLDKYIGDALVGIFGAPIALENHRLGGLRTALDMQKRLAALAPEWRQAGYPDVITRIGLNTGLALVGNMGSKERLNYTMMGDTVNLASRLEGANKAYGTLIMVAEECLVGMEEQFEVRDLDLLAVKGKTLPVKVYELMAEAGELDSRTEGLRGHYLDGIAAYRKRDWTEAIRCFQKALEVDAADGPSNTYLDRCFEYLRQPPPDDWDGVFRMKTK